MKNKLLLSALSAALIIFSTTSQATFPEKCPGAKAIAAIGVDFAEATDKNWSTGAIKNAYDTKETWSFVVGFFDAKDSDEALSKTRAALSTLVFDQGPIMVAENKFACIYRINLEGAMGFAITPAYSGDMKSMVMRMR